MIRLLFWQNYKIMSGGGNILVCFLAWGVKQNRPRLRYSNKSSRRRSAAPGINVINFSTYLIMNDRENKSKKKVSGWLVVGVLVLIALLLVWLTVADLFGDTDVAAMITPML